MAFYALNFFGSPYKGTMNRSSWAYLMVLGMTIVQNPHAHCGTYENHYFFIMGSIFFFNFVMLHYY